MKPESFFYFLCAPENTLTNYTQKMRITVLILFVCLTITSFGQDKPAYKVFTGEGKKSDYEDIIKETSKSDFVFFGELHDNPIAHWLELELTKSLYAVKARNLMLAAEMFETDNQILIDEYFAGIIKESSFETEIRKWSNYSTDYKPLLNFAKENGLKFVASNIPRRYAAVVATGGFEALEKISADGKKFIPPLPVEYDPELPCYKDMLSMGGDAKSHSSPNIPKAQAIKDATMAYSILKNWQKGKYVLHFNGSYHSDRHMGIIWYLKRNNPDVKVSTIATVLQDDINKLNNEFKGTADFIIVVPSSMTKTYKTAGQ
jgi:uncharacterized iron-regulated protein